MIPQSCFYTYSQGNEIRILKSYLYSYVHFSIVHSSQHIEITYTTINRRTNKEKVAYISQKILFCLKQVGNPAICNTMGGSGEHYAERRESDAERQVPHNLIYILNPNQSHSESRGQKGSTQGLGQLCKLSKMNKFWRSNVYNNRTIADNTVLHI